MDNKMAVFNNREFGSIRVIEQNGKYLFCGSDVAKALGYAIPTKAVNTHCKGVSKMETPTAGGIQKLLFITEPANKKSSPPNEKTSAPKQKPKIHTPHLTGGKTTSPAC